MKEFSDWLEGEADLNLSENSTKSILQHDQSAPKYRSRNILK